MKPICSDGGKVIKSRIALVVALLLSFLAPAVAAGPAAHADGEVSISGVTTTGATLSWAALDDSRVVGYNIYRVNPFMALETLIASTATNSITFTDLTPGTYQHLRVAAVNGNGGEVRHIGMADFMTLGHAGGGCTAAYRVLAEWWHGFQGEVTIRCPAAVTSWQVSLTYPANPNNPLAVLSISDHWSSTMTRNGDTYTFGNAAWNGSVPAGGSVTFGFIGDVYGPPTWPRLT